MKFLCVECDEAMSLKETKGPENGSMTVLFACGTCNREIAMLTNSMETQMVHSLGVKIGGAKKEAAPMETISSSLIGYQGEIIDNSTQEASEQTTQEETSQEQSSGGCPFSQMVAGSTGTSEDTSGSSDESALSWTPEAEARMERIPSFVRPMVERGIEDYAKANHATLVDEEMLKIVREKFGF